MPHRLRIQPRSYDALRDVATRFLRQYHPTGAIPVPIEEIVEFQFRIDIVPIPGLHREVDTDACLSNDMTVIFVDQFVYEERPNRYRFSLAHELAHVVLHPQVFRELRFSTIREWTRVVASISEEDYGWLEWQAYALAGLILVPADALALELRLARRRLGAAGLSPAADPDMVGHYLAGHLAKVFRVSPQVIQKRIEKDGLLPSA